MMFSLNCWEATIWFIRRIVLISLTQNGAQKRRLVGGVIGGFRSGCGADAKTPVDLRRYFKMFSVGKTTLEHNHFA